MAHGYIAIRGMTCQHCVNRVMQAIKELDGVQDVMVLLEAERAEIEFDAERLDLDRIRETIINAGYLTIEVSS